MHYIEECSPIDRKKILGKKYKLKAQASYAKARKRRK